MGSPQSSLAVPSMASLDDRGGSEGEQDAMSADALAEDERTAEAAASLKDESQVGHSHVLCCLKRAQLLMGVCLNDTRPR